MRETGGTQRRVESSGIHHTQGATERAGRADTLKAGGRREAIRRQRRERRYTGVAFYHPSRHTHTHALSDTKKK